MDHLTDFMASGAFIPHGHCFLWIPSLLWLHVGSDTLIGLAYVGIAILLYVLVRTIRLPFSPVFIAFGLFIGLCGLTHFMDVWTVWNPHYWVSGYLKLATAAASVATAIGLIYVRPQVQEVVYAARLSEQRRERLESANAELTALYDKVKELDELKSQFFANVSHELRTPLALILGPADRLLAGDDLSAEQRRQLESINQNAKTLVKQVNDLLDVAKLEAGRMRIRHAHLDLAPWFRMIGSQFEVAAEQRAIDYRIEAPEELAAEVDPDLLERVFINLLANAFKFTPAGGRIRARLQADAETLRFAVVDSGPGVDPAQRELIFERFRQAEGGSTRKHGGTGLGLAIVKDFVELHGGTVGVDAAPGGGAVFTVRLPRRAPAGSAVAAAPAALTATTRASLEGSLQELASEARQPAPPGTVARPGRPHALVVEDNPDMRHFVAEILGEDYNVTTAADGHEGLERAEALRPDLIVTDIMMPRLSGDQLVRELRRRPAFAPVPILLLSARADDQLRIELLREGAQDYLNKPFLPLELKARAANLMAMKRAGDALRDQLDSLSVDLEGLAREVAIRNRQLQTALEAAEVAREQAERASQAKSYFLGMISHELRTPLSTIKMNLQLLLRDRGGTLPEPLRPRLERLLGASQQLHAIIEGLLEYTRVESGRVEARQQTVDVVALATETVEEYRQLGLPAGVSLQLEPPPALPALHSDPRLLKVVLGNLLSNALKFTEAGEVTVRLAAESQGLVLAVDDTGLGIPADALGRIFEPFEQLEPVHRKSTPGVGLGLALVKQLAEALGGRIDVASTPDRGSSFRVTLPLAAEPRHT